MLRTLLCSGVEKGTVEKKKEGEDRRRVKKCRGEEKRSSEDRRRGEKSKV
jgi:hypothetical protein